MQAASIAKVVCLLTAYTRDTHHPHNGDTTSHAAAHDRVFNTQRLAYDDSEHGSGDGTHDQNGYFMVGCPLSRFASPAIDQVQAGARCR